MPIDKDSGWVEPDIIVNGRALTFAECLTLRVAVSQFGLWLTAPKVRAELGLALAAGYRHHLQKIEQAMVEPPPAADVVQPNVFHDHLDVCAQCRDNPLDLCATGARLLREAVDAGDRP